MLQYHYDQLHIFHYDISIFLYVIKNFSEMRKKILINKNNFNFVFTITRKSIELFIFFLRFMITRLMSINYSSLCIIAVDHI